MRLLVGTVVVGLLLPVGCELGQTCTDAGCIDGGEPISIAGPEFAGLPDGQYEIELNLDQSQFSIVCDTAQRNSECVVEGDAAGAPRGLIDNDGRIRIGFEGSRPASYQLWVEGPDGQTAERDGTFTYEETRPNGPDCGPVCRTVVEEVTVELEAVGNE